MNLLAIPGVFEKPEVRYLFTGIGVLVTAALIILLFKTYKKTKEKYLNSIDSIANGSISKVDMTQKIERYLKQAGHFGSFSLIYIDLDNFSGLNDLLGRETADRILVEIANRILRILPNRCYLTRYVNDEYLIFIRDEYDREDLLNLSEDIEDEIEEPLQILHDDSITITSSIGIATYPTSGETLKELIDNLGLATYVSKRNGKGKATIYYAELGDQESSNLEYFNEIKQAIKNKEFVMYYHPIINTDKDEIYGFEGLLRWNHPKLGLLSPAKFINVLEQSGDIIWVGQWSLEQLIKQQIEFEKYNNKATIVSLNLSTRELMDTGISESFIKIARQYKISPDRIVLEISEFSVYERMNQIKMNLLKLRDYGFKIAVDGFALDYQALSRIEHEPIDIIKLDREFLQDIENNFLKERFVTMLVDFADKNNRVLISEGVENDKMISYVKEQGIHYTQGYYYAKPMSGENAISYIRNKPWLDPNYEPDQNIESLKGENESTEKDNTKGFDSTEEKELKKANKKVKKQDKDKV